MSGRSRRRRLPDPHDLLAGRLPVRLEELFDLIHAVNPSGRDLSGRRLADAYAVKARLQSLLIERFGDRLVVEEVPGAPEGTIGLAHRTYAKDACHAIVRGLSPKARAWVRLQLDLRCAEEHGRSGHPESTGPIEAPADEGPQQTGPAGLLARGEAGLTDYDFELARECFHAVLSHPDATMDEPMVVRAARALLGLLVDHLADDQGALALREGLPAPAAQDEEVCCLLALAAARQGEYGTAQKLIRALEHERVHEVRVELARSALAAGQVDECERMLTLVPAGSAYSSFAQHVADAARRRRAEAAKPVEEEIEAVLESGDLDLAERLARKLLVMHGGSTLARRALTEVRLAREAAEANMLAAQIETALEAEDAASARTALQRLQAACGERQELQERVRHAERAQAAVRERAEIVELAREFRGELDARVVEAFWAASETVRDAVRRQVPHPEIRWLHEIGPVKGHGRGAMATALAAAAFACSERALDAGDAAAAAEAATPHKELARHSPGGRALLKRLRTALAEERRRVAARRLEEAERKANDSVPLALALLDRIDVRDLDDAARVRCSTLGQRLRTEELVLREHENLEAAQAHGDLLQARAAAARLADVTGEEEHVAWLACCEGLTQEIRALWNEDDHDGAPELSDVIPDSARSVAAVQVTQDGDAFVLANQCGRRIFIRIIHLDACRSRSAVLRSPEPLSLTNIQVEDRTLWLIAREFVLRVDLEHFDVLDLHRFADLDIRGTIDSALVAPGGRRLWVGCIGSGGAAVSVLDCRSWTVERHLEGCKGVFPVWGAPSRRLVLSRNLNDIEIADDRGVRMSAANGQYAVHGAVIHPGGQAFIVLKSDPRRASDGSGVMLMAHVWLPGGRWGEALELGSMNPDGFRQVATSLAHGSTFVSCTMLDGGHQLIALRADGDGDGDGLTELWRTPSMPHIFLAHDDASRHVLAVRNDGETVSLVPLSAEPVKFESGVPLPDSLPDLDPYKTCRWQPKRIRQRASAYHSLLPLVDADEVTTRIRGLLAGSPDLESIAALYVCSKRLGLDDELLERMRAEHGTDPIVRILAAEPLIRSGEHAKALESLEDLRLDEFEAQTAQHIAHLRAICYLVLGEEKSSRRALRGASKFAAQSCELAPLSALIDALLAPLRGLLVDERGATLRNLVARLRAAEGDLECGDAEAARSRLEHPVIWARREVQLIARLADAYLRLGDGDGDGNGHARLRKRYVLAELVQAMTPGARRPCLSLGRATWPSSRLEELAQRACSWLDDDYEEVRVCEQDRGTTLERLVESDSPFIITKFEPEGPSSSAGTVLSDPVSGQMLRSHGPGLLAEAREMLPVHPNRCVVGLVLDPELPEAGHYRSAREHLLGKPCPGPEVALVVPLEAALKILSRWRPVFDEFIAYHSSSELMGCLTLLLVRPTGAGLDRVSMGKP